MKLKKGLSKYPPNVKKTKAAELRRNMFDRTVE
jgi:hypothetical protein